MRQCIYILDEVNRLLSKDNIEAAAKKFANALVDFNTPHLRDETTLPVDFAGLERLFKIDRTLSKVNRNTFWQSVNSYSENTLPSLPADIQLYIETAMKSLPATNDPYRILQIQSLFETNNSLSGLQYLIARALVLEGTETNNQQKIQQSLTIFTRLAPLVDAAVILLGDGSQSNIFSQERINALISYLRFLEPKQALAILDDELNTSWPLEAGYLHDHLITRREALADAVNLKEKIEKALEESSRQYQIKHIEILVIFFTLISFVTGVLHIVPAQKTLSESLWLLIGFSLSLIAFMGTILTLLASTRLQKLCRCIVGLSTLILLCIGTMFLDTRVEQPQSSTQIIIKKSEDFVCTPQNFCANTKHKPK